MDIKRYLKILLCAAVAWLGFAIQNTQAETPTLAVQGIGVNLSGLEYPWLTYPAASDLDYIKSHGITFIRLPIAWERLQPQLGGLLDRGEIKKFKAFLKIVEAKGLKVIVDLHNYGRYDPLWHIKAKPEYKKGQKFLIGSKMLPVSRFAMFWRLLAEALKDEASVVGYGLMNEPHHMLNKNIWPEAAQAAVDMIRVIDQETTIIVAGDTWASAKLWLKYNADLDIKDPVDNLVYEAHQYFDNGSGRYNQSYDEEGATPDKGTQSIKPFLDWLKAKNVKGFIGEFGVPASDPRWLDMLGRFVDTLKKNNLTGTYWCYMYSDPSGKISWWPPRTGAGFDMILTPYADGSDKPQWDIITKK